ncbi:MAG: metallophosphoesterase [Proteobacteria bacterium]|nr:metallophosphoesterase [Pseudomonadota bacterium]MBU1059238.1 metallophosphoesterase [Pseudomonadota bacterium]
MKRNVALFVLLFLVIGCGNLHTPPLGQPEDQVLNFVVMGDNRPADVFRPEQPYIYHKVVAAAVALNPALILNTGDLVFGYDTLSQEKATEEFDDFEAATAPIREKGIPLYITMGNHSGYTEFARQAFRNRYENQDTGRLYYSFDVKNSHFIILCSELENEESQITGEQMEWLKMDLKGTKDKHIFVLLHKPLYPKIKHLEDSMNKHPEKRDALADLFKQYNVDMVFVGHVHVYNFSVVSGLNQIIAGGSGAPLAGTLGEGGFNHFFHVIINGDDIDYRLLPLQNEVLLATQLISEGRIQGAISLAEKAIEILPAHPMPNIIATVGYKVAEHPAKYAAGITVLQSILGSEEEVYFRLGEFCLDAKLLDLADLFLAKALNMTANSFKVLYHCGKLKMAENQYAIALEMYKKALPLTDNDYFKLDIQKQIKTLEEKM